MTDLGPHAMARMLVLGAVCAPPFALAQGKDGAPATPPVIPSDHLARTNCLYCPDLLHVLPVPQLTGTRNCVRAAARVGVMGCDEV